MRGALGPRLRLNPELHSDAFNGKALSGSLWINPTTKHDSKALIMKKALYALQGVLILAFVAAWLYLQRAHATFVDRSIRTYTGIDTYTLSAKEHSEYDWYASLRISENDGSKLLQKYPFRQGFSKAVLVRKLANPYVNDCPSCWYYLDDKGRGPYDYRLFLLSGDKEHLTVYELFGN